MKKRKFIIRILTVKSFWIHWIWIDILNSNSKVYLATPEATFHGHYGEILCVDIGSIYVRTRNKCRQMSRTRTCVGFWNWGPVVKIHCICARPKLYTLNVELQNHISCLISIIRYLLETSPRTSPQLYRYFNLIKTLWKKYKYFI